MAGPLLVSYSRTHTAFCTTDTLTHTHAHTHTLPSASLPCERAAFSSIQMLRTWVTFTSPHLHKPTLRCLLSCQLLGIHAGCIVASLVAGCTVASLVAGYTVASFLVGCTVALLPTEQNRSVCVCRWWAVDHMGWVANGRCSGNSLLIDFFVVAGT